MKNDVTMMRVIMSLITHLLFSFTSRAFHTNSQSELPLSLLPLSPFSLSILLSISMHIYLLTHVRWMEYFSLHFSPPLRSSSIPYTIILPTATTTSMDS